VNEKGNRNSPGTSPEGTETTMTNVNVHSGVKPEDNSGKQNRGSAGCVTCHPDDAINLFGNFDFSNTSGNTGNAQRTITIFRGETPESEQAKNLLVGTPAPAPVLPQVVIQPDATSVVKPVVNIIKPKK
jgi:hypothetical protein